MREGVTPRETRSCRKNQPQRSRVADLGYDGFRMNLRGGYLRLGSVRGAPIRVHWSTPLGLIVLSGFAFAPGAWLMLALLVLVHELGHATISWKLGYSVERIDINAFGGSCECSGDLTRYEAALIAWGGVLAQAMVLVLAVALSWAGMAPPFAHVLIASNAWLIAVNLLPIPGLDGALAWHLPIAWAAERGFRFGGAARRAERHWSRSKEWLDNLEREQKKEAGKKTVASDDDGDGDGERERERDAKSIPESVRKVLERIVGRKR